MCWLSFVTLLHGTDKQISGSPSVLQAATEHPSVGISPIGLSWEVRGYTKAAWTAVLYLFPFMAKD